MSDDKHHALNADQAGGHDDEESKRPPFETPGLDPKAELRTLLDEQTDRIMAMVEDPSLAVYASPFEPAPAVTTPPERPPLATHNAAMALIDCVYRDDPACVTPVAAIATIAAHFGLESLGLRLSVKDFAALRGLLTSAEQEEQARRWGGSEMRFLTRADERLLFTRVTVADGVV